VRCHNEIARSYAQHPMGRSLRPVDERVIAGITPLPGHGPFDAAGLRYEVKSNAGHMVHGEALLDSDGHTITQNEAEARFVVGSGEQALTFLIERGDGYLFESPISWYVKEGLWDLAPGYKMNGPHFERPIGVGCLFCHANHAEAVEESENHYRDPIFQGYAIGCERCHGPGEHHAQQPAVQAGELPNIVNPANLEPILREGSASNATSREIRELFVPAAR
jgi:hypothetical protein